MALRSLLPAICALAVMLGGVACDRKGDDQNRNMIGTSGDAREMPITVTGCVQEARGIDAFVLSDVASDRNVAPEEKRPYKLEDGRDLDQYVGRQVRVKGRLEEDSKTVGTSGEPENGRRLKMSDLAALHVDSIERVADSCSGPAAPIRQY